MRLNTQMQIIVHNYRILTTPSDVHHCYNTPVWEVEIQSDLLDTPEFDLSLRLDENFDVSQSHRNIQRSTFCGTGVVAEFLAQSQRDFILDLVSSYFQFNKRYFQSIDHYKRTSGWQSIVLRDQPGFQMKPHIDNSHVMAQMVVNLLEDNDTSTEFYYFNDQQPCYRAPLKKNHGVIFLNTPGAVHSISNINKTRWILYSNVLI